MAALSKTSLDLWDAGHRARALDYSQRALAAGQGLGPQDCLILADLQVRHANMVYNFSFDRLAQRAPGAALEVAAVFLPLVFAAAATVQRRRAAGTLLPGSCRATEEEWARLAMEPVSRQNSDRRVHGRALPT